jgi:cystathionine beta-lyase
MALRMERSIANAEKIAEFLAGHPLVRKLNYAGRPEHPGADVHAAQSTSGGAMISFETGAHCSSEVRQTSDGTASQAGRRA